MRRVDFEIKQHTDWRVYLAVEDLDENPIDASGFGLEVRLADGDTAVKTLTIGNGVTLLNPPETANGRIFQFQIDLTAAQTAALPSKAVQHEVVLIEPSGRVIPYFNGVTVVTKRLPVAP